MKSILTLLLLGLALNNVVAVILDPQIDACGDNTYLKSGFGARADCSGFDLTAYSTNDNWADYYLVFAKFNNANLSGVDLSGLDLRFANFQGADLTGTDFTGADLVSLTLFDLI